MNCNLGGYWARLWGVLGAVLVELKLDWLSASCYAGLEVSSLHGGKSEVGCGVLCRYSPLCNLLYSLQWTTAPSNYKLNYQVHI